MNRTARVIPFAVTGLLLAACSPVYADLILPVSFVYETKLFSFLGILAVLVIEFAFLRDMIFQDSATAIFSDLVMNGVSTLLGLLFIPVARMIIDQITWKHDMHQIGANSFTFLFVVAANTIIEGYAVQRVFDKHFGGREYLVLAVANACSTGAISAAMAIQARQGTL